MDKLKEEVVSNIRACLISFKGRVSVRQLESDYRTLLGEKIPYAKLGYKDLNSFMLNIPSLLVTANPNGELFVDAKASDKSNHITDMVNRQKSVREKPGTVRHNKKVNFSQANRWNPPNISRPSRKFKQVNRPAVSSHNQLVSRSPRKVNKYTVASKIVIPEHSTFNFSKRNSSDTHSENGLDIKCYLPESYETENNNGTKSPLNDESSVKFSRLRNSNCSNETTVENGSFGHSLTLATKKRLCKKMSEITLIPDISDIETNTTSLPSLNIPLTDNLVLDLQNLADYYKLGPVSITSTPMRQKRGPILYNCKITVDGQTFLSYPKDFRDEKSATDYCARKALDELIPKCIRKKILLLSNDRDVKERIPPLLRVHFQGIWSWQVEADYVDQYMEQLPSNWLEIIDSLDCVAVEKIQDKFVLRYCRPGTALQKGKDFSSLVPFDISVPSNTVQFREDDRLFGQIRCIMSLNEIWCCQFETNEWVAYNDMIKLMLAHYDGNNEKKASTIQVGSYYIAKADETWYRVKALEINENKVNCFLIDYGDEYTLDLDNLYQMKREFATSPAQAFLCRLAGLEDLYDTDIPVEKLNAYVGKDVIIEGVDNTDDSDTDQSLPVVMYDLNTSKSINEELLKFVTTEEATPRIKESIQEVYVTNITDLGDVYVQVRTKGFARLESLLQTLSQEIESNNTSAEKIAKLKWQTNKDRIYLYKDTNNQLYSRIKITDMSPDGNLAQIEFIDTGICKIVMVSTALFHPLEKISDVLHQFPAQSVRVKMYLETIPKNFVEITTKLMKLDASVLLKVMGVDDNGTHLGEFYRRSSHEEGLFCINKAITMQFEIDLLDTTFIPMTNFTRHSLHQSIQSFIMSEANVNPENQFFNSKDSLSRLSESSPKLVRNKPKFSKDETPNRENVPSGGSLERPILPGNNEYFEVKIPFAVNPWNFFVQPYESLNQLNNLMEKLQEYSRTTKFSPLQISGILPGQIYAIKHSDNNWYRISILKVIHAGSISVFFCDFGYYSSVSVNQLVPLDPKFLDLPYQAMKAKLSGIRPKKSKWSMEDCDYFIELVKDKSFVSVIKDIENDELYESDVVLKLILIDTSNDDDDVHIDEELIKKGIAVEAE